MMIYGRKLFLAAPFTGKDRRRSTRLCPVSKSMNNFRVWHLPAAWKHATVYKLQFKFLSQSQCQSQSLCHKLSWHFPHLAASFNLKSISMSFDWNVPHAHAHAPAINPTQIDDHLELKICLVLFPCVEIELAIDDRANRSPHQSMQQVRWIAIKTVFMAS